MRLNWKEIVKLEVIELDRMRMPRINRAAQFAPFDALKGLQEALRVKEFEHDKIAKSELSEEQAKRLSKILLEFDKGDVLEVTYFKDGYYINESGSANFIPEEGLLVVAEIKIPIDNISNIENLSKK